MRPARTTNWSVPTIMLLGFVLALGGLVPAASAKSVNQSYPVPENGVLKVTGRGYGHGHGMSQYGARGAARQGLNWKQILAFYYPGTKRGATASEIRVLITADTSAPVAVRWTKGLRVRDLASGKEYKLPEKKGVKRWRLRPDGVRNVIAYHDGKWRPWRTLPGLAEFHAGAEPVTLILPGGVTRAYRGALRAVPPSANSGDRDTVNVLSIDDYIKGVVPAEMPATWERPAVRAQAVAARTYAAWSRATRSSQGWQICDTTACQVYGGVASEHPSANNAVDATAGVILRYDGKPAFTQFSSSSGGRTSAGSVPYLVSQADPYEKTSGNPYTNWNVELKAATIERAYPTLGKLKSIKVTSREGAGQWKGRVWTLVLKGTKKDVTVTGDDFRFKFGLRSTWFTFK